MSPSLCSVGVACMGLLAGPDKASQHLQVCLASDQKGLVVRSTRNFIKLLRLACGLEEAAAKPVRDYIVLLTVDEQLWAANVGDLTYGIHFGAHEKAREKQENGLDHIRDGRETGLHDEPLWPDAGREIDGHSPAQGFPEQDDAPGGYPALEDKVVPGRLGVEIQALFRGTTLAFPVSPVIDDEDIDRQSHKPLDHVVPVGDVARVAVKKEENHLSLM